MLSGGCCCECPRDTMAFMGCTGSQGACLQAVEEAVKENALTRLTSLLAETTISVNEIDRKNLLHQAAWLGYPTCVRMLLENGAASDEAHRKNGCTPLHLAHFCTVDDSNPAPTIQALIGAGANVNNPGGDKCGRLALDHAIQHQRLDSVTELLRAGSNISLQSILSAIDVASPQILTMLLSKGGDCGKHLESIVFWGEPLSRVLYAPLKGPKECYRQMFNMLVQATVCMPVHLLPCANDPSEEQPKSEEAEGGGGSSSNNTNSHHPNYSAIDSELKTLAKECTDPTVYLYSHLIRNGFWPSESIKIFMAALTDTEWVDEYLRNPPTLRDLCMRVSRAYLFQCGNIISGVERLKLPPRVRDIVCMYNPLV